MKKLLVIDSHSILYKSHFAFGSRQLTNSSGMTTSALYGFLRTFMALIKQFKPDYMCFAFDKSRETFRRKLFPDYKAHRSATPDELREQLPYAPRLAKAMNIQTLMLDNFEADDILGSVAHQFSTQNQEVEIYLITGDRDAFQLIKDRVWVGYTSSKTKDGVDLWDESRVLEKYELPPKKLIQVKALQGDTSDNIPGVKGVGEKTAIKLIKEFDSLENLYENIDSVKGKLKDKLIHDKELAFTSEVLAKICTDIDLPFSLEDLKFTKDYTPELSQLLIELEFKSIHSSLFPNGAPLTADQLEPAVKTDYNLVLSEDDLTSLVSKLKKSDCIGFDTETSLLDAHRAKLVGFSFATADGLAWYIPTAHRYLGSPKQLSTSKVLQELQPLFTDPSILFVGHNLKYDFTVLKKHGSAIPTNYADTMIMAHLLHPNSRKSLKILSQQFLGISREDFSDLVEKGSSFSSIPLKQALNYAAADADESRRLYNRFKSEIDKDPELCALAESIEFPLVSILVEMEIHGIAIDSQIFDRLATELTQKSGELQSEIIAEAGSEFNLNSTKQLAQILFEKLGIPPLKKTKTGYSTATDVLTKLAGQYPICKNITEYRHLKKLLSTYVLPLPELADQNKLIHTSYNQTVVATGRLSSTNPNLQNIPIRTDWGRKIRQGFIPTRPNHELISIDYSQIELRILAHLAKDPSLTEAFIQNRDIHRETAAKVFSRNPDEVTYEERSSAKAINFGIVYGISPFGLSQQLEIPVGSAKEFIDSYFRAYPGIQEFLINTGDKAIEDGFVRTMFGRVRPIDELGSTNRNKQEAGRRMAVNSIIQGSAAELIKLAMVALDDFLGKKNLSTKVVLQVHDELIFEAPKSELKIIPDLKQLMENVYQFNVPIVCDVETGSNWGNLATYPA